jgi:hypothetical protein
MIDMSKLTIPSSTGLTFTKPQENNIVFCSTMNGNQTEVLRITKDGITANPDVPVDEAADAVIRALDGYIKNLTKRTWVGLTDEEIEQGCKESWVTEQAFQSAAWWADAKLKEKNT